MKYHVVVQYSMQHLFNQGFLETEHINHIIVMSKEIYQIFYTYKQHSWLESMAVGNKVSCMKQEFKRDTHDKIFSTYRW